MRSVINSQATKEEKKFPKLMVADSGNVYLVLPDFRATRIYVAPGFRERLGEHIENVSSYELEDFDGSITIWAD